MTDDRRQPRVRTLDRHQQVGKGQLAKLLSPRDDLLAETRTSYRAAAGNATATFTQAAGPFLSYQRSVAAHRTPDGTAWHTTQRFEYELHVPTFGFLVQPLARWSLLRPRADGKSPIWAPPTRFNPQHVATLCALCVLTVAVGYWSNAPSEMHTYAADEFNATHFSQGLLGAIVRVGTLVAIGASVLADRYGRRRVLGLAVALNLACSVAAAAAPNLAAFTVALTLGRTATAALAATLVVMVLEEMPAGSRAWSMSVLALCGALGAGAVLWFQPLAQLGERAWRLVFVVPLLASPLIVLALRRLDETRRFVSARTRHYLVRRRPLFGRGRWPLPPELRLRSHWRGVALLGFVFAAMGLFLGPLDWFRNEYLRDEHGFTATQVSLFLLTSATPGGIGLFLAGRWADIRGRRVVIGVAAVLGLGAATLMFRSSGAALWLLALTAAVTSSGLIPALGVYRGEMFPTSVRARLGTVAAATGVIGSSIGILLVGWLTDVWGSFAAPMTLLWVGPLVGAVAAIAWLKEGSLAELEQLNPVDA